MMRDAMKNSVFKLLLTAETQRSQRNSIFMKHLFLLFVTSAFILTSCAQQLERVNYSVKTDNEIKTGAAQTDKYLALLKGKKRRHCCQPNFGYRQKAFGGYAACFGCES
jgi:hypothetical protein